MRIRLRGYSPERFLNLCRARNIEIWELKSSGLSYEMNVSIRDFWKLKPLRKKARAHVEILERHGLPFFLYRNRSRKMFPAGILLCAVFLYVMSLFIWNIHIEGNYSRTTDVILDYLETEQVVHGMRKSQVDCKEIQSMLRIEFPDIIWVSAEVKGTRLLIRVRENTDMEEAETKIRLYRPKLIYTMPNVQNPTGITYSKAKKRKLLGLARHYGAYILEDDSLSGLYYQTENTKPIKTYDQDERVIYILSLSKLFMPGLRLGYLLVPTELLARVRTILHLADIATSGFFQRVYDYYLRNGLWSKHLTSLKKSYQQRFEYCQQLLEKQLGKQVSYQLPQGGLTFWLKLPAKVSAKMVAQKAKKQGVLVTPGQVFYARQADDSHLRISFAGVDEQQAKEALTILGQIIKAE